MNEQHTQILIVGGGTGGVAAALGATAMGRTVILTEETPWLGGQLTSQAVPPDEHPWIEWFGCTLRYRRYRELVRRYYREHFSLTPLARQNPRLNPGGGRVSNLCHLPRVGVTVIDQMLAAARAAGLLEVRHHLRPIAADVTGDRVRAVTLEDARSGERQTITADYVIDATELGELLPLAGVEYVSGAESRDETGEVHAAVEADADNVQAISWCFAMAFDPAPGADHVIDKPNGYDRWRDYEPNLTPPWPGPMLRWEVSFPKTLETRSNGLTLEHTGTGTPRLSGIWNFRKLHTLDHFPPEHQSHEITLVNWPMIDYVAGNLIDKPEALRQRYLDEAKEQSLCFFYWMQTEAPRPDGGQGFAGLYLRPDVTGTPDGLAMYPYIRESRRIRAMTTILEHHVGTEARTGHPLVSSKAIPIEDLPFSIDHMPRSERFRDSVGVGAYRIDLHPSTGGDNYIDISSLPFQIPLGALLPVRMTNLLPAAKNIGTTHITNGCYRLHPVEWNIGEVAGLLATFCLDHATSPHAVHESDASLDEFQRLLDQQGIERDWPILYPL